MNGMASALFAATQYKVLQILFLDPHRSFFASEIISIAASGSGAVQRELARLVDSGLAIQSDIGRQRHFRANMESPIYEELRGIIDKLAGVPNQLRAALQPFENQVEFAMLYGSTAKGMSRSASDIDVLIVGDDIRLEKLYSAFEGVEMAVRRKVNPTIYSRDEFRRRRNSKHPFITRVLAGETVPLIGTLDDVGATRKSRKDQATQTRNP